MLTFSSYLEIIYFLIEYMVFYYLFSQVFKRRFKNSVPGFALIGILTGTNFLIDVYAGLISGPAMVVKFTLVFLAFWLIFDSKALHSGLMTILLIICIAVSDIIVALGLIAVFGFDNFSFITSGIMRPIVFTISKVIFVMIIRAILSRFKDLNSTDPKDLYTIVMVLLIDVGYIVLACDIYFQNKSIFDSELLFTSAVLIGIVVISMLVVRMTESIVTYAMKERDWEMQEEEYNRQIYYLNHLDEINHEMKSIRHDFNHHIGCLYGMLEQGELDNARVYASELVNEAEQFNVAFSSEYPGVSGLLSSKYQIMRAKKIDFQWSVSLPKAMKIKLIDLSVILGNALDNAIEAVEKIDEKNIELRIYYDMDYIVIKTINKFKHGTLNSDFSTSKVDFANHGYGLSNIKFIVSKYDGILKIDTIDGEFKLNIALPC